MTFWFGYVRVCLLVDIAVSQLSCGSRHSDRRARMKNVKPISQIAFKASRSTRRSHRNSHLLNRGLCAKSRTVAGSFPCRRSNPVKISKRGARTRLSVWNSRMPVLQLSDLLCLPGVVWTTPGLHQPQPAFSTVAPLDASAKVFVSSHYRLGHSEVCAPPSVAFL